MYSFFIYITLTNVWSNSISIVRFLLDNIEDILEDNPKNIEEDPGEQRDDGASFKTTDKHESAADIQAENSWNTENFKHFLMILIHELSYCSVKVSWIRTYSYLKL